MNAILSKKSTNERKGLREKCQYSEFFWSVFSHIWAEYGENTRNSDYGHFSRSKGQIAVIRRQRHTNMYKIILNLKNITLLHVAFAHNNCTDWAVDIVLFRYCMIFAWFYICFIQTYLLIYLFIYSFSHLLHIFSYIFFKERRQFCL